MEHFNGGTILLFLLLVVIVCVLVYYVKNRGLISIRRGTPLQQAQREWCKYWNTEEARKEAEETWEELGAEELMKATTLSELCSACECVFWYSHRGKYKKRESKILLKVYEGKKEELKDQLKEEKARQAEEFRKNKDRDLAPRPKKISKGQQGDGKVIFPNFVKKEAQKS
ncbi:MAG: hypothetical protein WC791_04205 [Candidatus Paceibacterota bacterium]|jgi:hypothetical protein